MKNNFTLSLFFFLAMTLKSQAQNIIFSDPNFKSALIDLKVVDTNLDGVFEDDVDLNNDNEISIAEAEQVISLKLRSYSIKGIKEIEYFKNLKYFDFLESNNVKNFPNVSKNVYLERFSFAINKDSLININGHPSLKVCSFAIQSPIKKIQINNNTKLTKIEFSGGFNSTLPQIDSIDFSYNALDTFKTKIISSSTKYSYLNCSHNKLVYINMPSSDNPFKSFEHIDFSYNNLNLDFLASDCEYFDISHNAFKDLSLLISGKEKKLNFSDNPLTKIYIYKNSFDTLNIDEIDFVGLTNLNYIGLILTTNDIIKDLKIHDHENLTEILIFANSVSEIVFEKLPKLTKIRVESKSKVRFEDVNSLGLQNAQINVENTLTLFNSLKGKTVLELSSLHAEEMIIINNPDLRSISFERLFGGYKSFPIIKIGECQSLTKITFESDYVKAYKIYLTNLPKLDSFISQINYEELKFENSNNLSFLSIKLNNNPVVIENFDRLKKIVMSSKFIDLRNLPSLDSAVFITTNVSVFNLVNLSNLKYLSLEAGYQGTINDLSIKNLPKLETIEFIPNSGGFTLSGNIFEIRDLPMLKEIRSKLTFYVISLHFNKFILNNLDNLIKLVPVAGNSKYVAISNCKQLNELYIIGGTNDQINIFNLSSLEQFRIGVGKVNELLIYDNISLKSVKSDQTSANSFKLINLPQLVKLDLNKGVNLYSTNFDPHIVFRNLPSLRSCYMNSARIDTLDFSQCAKLDSLTLESFDDKRDIKFLNLKNGGELKYFRNFFSAKIKNICVDNAIEESIIKSKIIKPNNTTYTYDCKSSYDYASFSGNVDVVNIFSGQNVLNSFYIPIDITDDNKNVKIFTEQNGKYSYKTKSLNKKITISPVIDLSHFEFQDTTKSYNPNEHLDYVNQNFTIYSNQLDVDLSAYIHINATIRPGREITCFIEIKNYSPFEANAGFTFEFDNKFMKFINNQNLTLLSPSLIEGKVSKIVGYSSFILPLTFLLNKPTDISPLIGGELLKFEFKVIPSQQDLDLANNTFVFNQRVINSMDPNNILCAQGDIVKSNEEIKTLTYTINFENLGTATAQDISIENLIDTNKLNINSFELINFSHNAKVSIIGDKAFFELNNIELPFSGKNKGYVSYSISPKKNLEIGDSITNQAKIYFDFNLPISTNQHILKLDVINKINEEPLEELIIYPNPNSGNFYLKGELKNISSLCIYNLLGTELGCYQEIENEIKTQLAEGHYLVKLQHLNGFKEVKKIIIKK